MSNHATLRLLLYDYITDALPEGSRSEVEEHLQHCFACREICEDMRNTLAVIPTNSDPAGAIPSAFWQELLNDVAAQLPARVQRRILPGWLSDWFEFIAVPRHQVVIGTVSLVVLLAAIAGSWLVMRQVQILDQVAVIAPPVKAAAVPTVNKRMKQYLRRSKALLVGINNMPLADGTRVDLSMERNTSRELLHEARYLKDQTIDEKSAALISDLEKIQIALANNNGRETVPRLQLIRGGIRDENLLFKIRIAETVYERLDNERAPSGR
jgi:hypothetical protein